jgi:leader peptidase (prepilin peptidase)/N-methyltransferase
VDYLDLLTVMPTATGLLGLVLGLVVGSFLNVVIIRLPPRLAYQWQHVQAVRY